MALAEIVELASAGGEVVQRIAGLGLLEMTRAKQAEPLFGESEEDVVLRGEVAVNRAWAVFDPRRDISDGNVGVSFSNEQLQGGIENGAASRFSCPLLAGKAGLNMVHLNTVQYDEPCSD